MSVLSIIFILLGALIVVGLVVYLIILITFKEEKTVGEEAIIINFADLKSGRAIGKEIESEEGSHDRKSVIFRPIDLSLKTIKENKEIPNVKVIVGKLKESPVPSGRWSKDITIKFLLPDHASDFPEEFRETPLGKFMMFYTELINTEVTQIDAMKEGFERQTKHIIDMGWGEASVAKMNAMNELYKDMLESLKEAKKDKGTTFNMPTSSGV